MPPLDAYLSPQSQQAVIAGMFLSFGWLVVAAQTRSHDARLRRDGERAAQMMGDYLSLMAETRDCGIHAIRVLTECLRGGPDAVEAMLDADEAEAVAQLNRHLPDELAQMRARLEAVSTRSSDPRGR